MICFPCPHNSVCCSWGATVSEEEKQQIDAIYWHAVQWCDEEDCWRIIVKDGACYFQKDNACTIHDQPYYPKVCSGFPHDYEWTLTICPDCLPKEER